MKTSTRKIDRDFAKVCKWLKATGQIAKTYQKGDCFAVYRKPRKEIK